MSSSSEKLSPLPWGIQFLAASMVVFGVTSLCISTYKFALGHESLHVGGIIGVLLGHFLLRRNERARKICFALLVLVQCSIAIGLVLCVVFAYVHFSEEKIWDGAFLVMIFFGQLLLIWPVVYTLRVMARPETIEIFTKDSKPVESGNWTSILVVIGLLMGAYSCVTYFRFNDLANNVYYYHATIHVVDSKTKRPISDTSLSGSPTTSSNQEKYFGLKHQQRIASTEEDWVITGIDLEPVKVSLNADGYDSKTVTIEPGTRTYIVELEPEK